MKWVFKCALSVRALLVGCVALLGPAAPALGQSYPTKPIQIVVPFPPGGNADMSVRFLSSKWSEFIGQPFVIINKPGAGSAVGAKFVADAQPDGYTLLAATDSAMVTVRIAQGDPGYSLESFDPLFAYGKGIILFGVQENGPYKTFADFVAAAKSQPGKLTYASYGVGTVAHFVAELLWRNVGVSLKYVPFRSSPEANAALLGGQVHMSVPAVIGGMKPGSGIRFLASTAPTRLAGAPYIPTLAEVGQPLELTFLLGLAAPKGIPDDVKTKLLDAHRKAMAKYRSEIEEQFTRLEVIPAEVDAAGMRKHLDDRQAWYSELAPSMGLAKK